FDCREGLVPPCWFPSKTFECYTSRCPRNTTRLGMTRMQETTSPRATTRLDSNLIIRIALWFVLAVFTLLVANAALKLPGRTDQVIVRLVTDLLIIAGGFFEVWLLTQRRLQNAYRRFQSVLALQFGALLFQRVYTVLFVQATYGPEI